MTKTLKEEFEERLQHLGSVIYRATKDYTIGYLEKEDVQKTLDGHKEGFSQWFESKLSEKSLGIIYEPGKTLEAGVEYITIKVSDFQAELSKAKQEAYEEAIHFIENHPDIAGGHILTKHIRSKFLTPKS